MKPSIPKGTRDFSPSEMSRRNYIFDNIREVFRMYGYAPLETPAMENLSTLLGKYGEEGDKLLFRILDSGDYLSNVKSDGSRGMSATQFEQILSISNDELDHNIAVIKQELESTKNIDEIGVYLESTFENFLQYIHYSLLKKKTIDGALKYIERLNSSTLKSDIRGSLRQSRKSLFDNSNKITNKIAEKGLRYDLTVPFARYVVQHQNDIVFPFRRYQIQPVWRADRPQKGRYREFYQCDVDVIGSRSLLNEYELVAIVEDVFKRLNINVVLKINNRKILYGIAESIGFAERMIDITIAIDKLDKIGMEGVETELLERGITREAIEKLKPVLTLQGTTTEKLATLQNLLDGSETGLKGIEEVEELFGYIKEGGNELNVELDLSLARGLNYYTGAIFEVKAADVAIGSICGGGRYDNLTGIFGLPDMSGVGISFGADRIYDVMTTLELFPTEAQQTTRVLALNFGGEELKTAMQVARTLRTEGIATEIYPDAAKIKKQMEYASRRGIPYVVIIGESELQAGTATIKDMNSGEQHTINIADIYSQFKNLKI